MRIVDGVMGSNRPEGGWVGLLGSMTHALSCANTGPWLAMLYQVSHVER